MQSPEPAWTRFIRRRVDGVAGEYFIGVDNVTLHELT